MLLNDDHHHCHILSEYEEVLLGGLFCYVRIRVTSSFGNYLKLVNGITLS